MPVYAVLLACLLVTQAHRPAVAEEDYNAVLTKSHLFYESQLSGAQPYWSRMALSNGGWRGDSHLKDGETIGKDLTGGFYDAGDFLKATQSLGWVLSNMALGFLEFRQGYAASGNEDVFYNQFNWGADWMVKAYLVQSDTPAENVFVGQVSNNLVDHKYLGRPEHHTTPRPVYTVTQSNPGADVASQFAASFAAAAIIAKQRGNPERSAAMYKRAKQAFGFAKAYKQNWIIPDGVFQAYKTYWPQGHLGHLAYAAAWLCKADSSNCAEAVQLYRDAASVNNIFYCLGYDYDSVLPGASMLLLGVTDSAVPSDVKTLAVQHLDGYVLKTWEDTSSKCPKQSYANVCYTPKGLAYYSDWGTLRNTGNMMMVAAVMAKYSPSNANSHKCWVRSQANYITGYSTGRSYLIGHGSNQPLNPHHRGAACAYIKGETACKLTAAIDAAANQWSNGTCCAGESYYSESRPCCDYVNFSSKRSSPITLMGGLVGGPDQTDTFADDRMDYQRNEVALDFNLGFTSAAAALAQWQAASALSNSCGDAPRSSVPDNQRRTSAYGAWAPKFPMAKFGSYFKPSITTGKTSTPKPAPSSSASSSGKSTTKPKPDAKKPSAPKSAHVTDHVAAAKAAVAAKAARPLPKATRKSVVARRVAKKLTKPVHHTAHPAHEEAAPLVNGHTRSLTGAAAAFKAANSRAAAAARAAAARHGGLERLQRHAARIA